MSGQYSDERFFFAHYGCCIPTESYAWILVVLFTTSIVVLLFCMLATATIRWMYKRRMRKRLQDLKKKYLHDQLKAQEFDAKLNHIALAQKNKTATNGNNDPKDPKSENFTIFVDPAQNYALHKHGYKKCGKDTSLMKTAIPQGVIYDRDETPIAQSTMPTQNHAVAPPHQVAPGTALRMDPPAPSVLAPPTTKSAPFVFNPPEKKASPVNTLDTELSPRSQMRLDKALAPPTPETTTVESTPNVTAPSTTTATSENKSPSSESSSTIPSTTIASSAPSAAPSSAPNTNPNNAPTRPPTTDQSTVASTQPPTTATEPPIGKKASPPKKISPKGAKTDSPSPSPSDKEEQKKHNVEYGMDDIVSPRASEKEKDSSRKEAAGGRSEWKYYHTSFSGSDARRKALSTTTGSSTSNRRSSSSWMFDSTGTSRFTSAPETPMSVSSSIIKTDSSQYRTASPEEFPHGAFSFEE